MHLHGHSRGSEKTGFWIPELKLFLDAGIQSYFHPENILITHCHSDHCFALPMLLTGIRTRPAICVPAPHSQLFVDFLESCRALFTGGRKKEEEDPIALVPVREGSRVELGREHFAQVYELDHSVPSVGYGILERRNKLRDDLKGLTGKELKNMLPADKFHVVEVPKLVFLCDTTPSIFSRLPELFKYPNIVVECTFLEPESRDLCREAKHTHWHDLEPIIRAHPDNFFILIHFSMRYENVSVESLPQNAMLWPN